MLATIISLKTVTIAALICFGSLGYVLLMICLAKRWHDNDDDNDDDNAMGQN